MGEAATIFQFFNLDFRKIKERITIGTSICIKKKNILN